MSVTTAQVEEIRRLHEGAVRARQIGEIVGVSIRTVNEVLAGKVRGRPLTPREQAALDVTNGWRAACMDDAEWAEWTARNPLHIADTAAAARPCADCPLGFAADMRAQGRCNGTPGGVAEDVDHQEEDDMTEQLAPGVEVDLVGGLPCETCAHAEVCRIRPSLAELRTVRVSMPAIDDAITLRVAADVECSAYLRAKKAAAAGTTGRKLNLSIEERERRRQSALTLVENQRKAREGSAS